MSFSRDKFTLFFSLPLDALDYQNLRASHVTRVMLPLAFSTYQAFAALWEVGVRSVVVRLGEEDYDTPQHRVAACSHLRALALSAQGRLLEAVILGVEPEQGVDLSYQSMDWQHYKARIHASNVAAMRDALRGVGLSVKLVSPGWTARTKSETEIAPGEYAWRELTAPVYHTLEGCGVHVYTYGFESIVDELRMLWLLSRWSGFWHKPLWIDEIGIDKGSQVERMRAYLWVADRLLDPALPAHHRVEMLCPFVSNGIPNGHWSPGLLLRDPAVYALLGAWMTS